jgi:hypothetical protein
LKKRGELDAERERELTSIGFEWQPHSKQWEQMFDALRKFHSDNRHCRVPSKWPENPKLASWVATQRARKAESKLSEDRIARLDALGFAWRVYSTGAQPQSEALETNDDVWEQMLAALETYRNEHRDCKVPAQWPPNPKLANWVSKQRQFKKSGKLKPERVAALEKIGFEWILGRGSVRPLLPRIGNALTATQAWEEMFLALQQYKQQHENCLVPQRWKENHKLADWVSEQRMAYNKGRLDAERTRRLEELGFDWDPNNTHWEKYYWQLVEFKKEHGNTNVPQRSGKYAALGTWVRNQRAAKRYNRPIMAERAKRLDEIGFVWMLIEPMSWEKMFAALVEFKKIHGHCNVPQKSREHKSLEQKRLGKWVNSQRTAYYRKRLPPERQRKLEEIGFVWNLRPNLAPAP